MRDKKTSVGFSNESPTIFGWGGFDSPFTQRLTQFFSFFAFVLTVIFTTFLAFTGSPAIYIAIELIPILLMLISFFKARQHPMDSGGSYLLIVGCYTSVVWSYLFLGTSSGIHDFVVVIALLPLLLLRLSYLRLFFFIAVAAFSFSLPFWTLPEFFTRHHLTGDRAWHFRVLIEATTFLLLLIQGAWFLRQQAGSWKQIEKHSDSLKAALHFRKEITQVIAHDVKEPLSTLLLGLRIAQKTENLQEIKTHLKRMESTSLNIHRVLDYLLSLAIAEQDPSTMMIEKSRFTIGTALKDLRPIYQGRMEEKNLLFDLSETQVEGHPVHCNQETFTFQILANLLGNALRAAPRGSTLALRVIRGDTKTLLEIENQVEQDSNAEEGSPRKPFGMKIVRKFCEWNEVDLEQVFKFEAHRHRQTCITRLRIPHA